MTVKKVTKCRGQAVLLARQQVPNATQQLDLKNLKTGAQPFSTVVCFNEQDQLELRPDSEGDKANADAKQAKSTKTDAIVDKAKAQIEKYNLEEIVNCITAEVTYNLVNTLIFYLLKHHDEDDCEAIVLKFEIEQDYKRIFFTYKYFKMRNRLATTTLSSYASNENLHLPSRRKGSIEGNRKPNGDLSALDQKLAKSEYDLMQRIDGDGVTHISVQQKYGLRLDQPSSLVMLKSASNGNLEEADSLLFVDGEAPVKPQRRKRLLAKFKYQAAPQPSEIADPQNKSILKGQIVRVNVSIDGQNASNGNDSKVQKGSDATLPRDKALWSNIIWPNRGGGGYESDREEWRSSRSTFSTSAFDSLSRPTRMAMAFTLRKPAPSRDLNPQYYRIANENKQIIPKHQKIYSHASRLPVSTYVDRNSVWGVPRLPRSVPSETLKKPADYRKVSTLPHENFAGRRAVAEHNTNAKKFQDYKKPSAITTKITGFTNKLKELSSIGNSQNSKARLVDSSTLKPVIKKSSPKDSGKRAIVRTCSVEPPKKVTFSAFATVQVV